MDIGAGHSNGHTGRLNELSPGIDDEIAAHKDLSLATGKFQGTGDWVGVAHRQIFGSKGALVHGVGAAAGGVNAGVNGIGHGNAAARLDKAACALAADSEVSGIDAVVFNRIGATAA